MSNTHVKYTGTALPADANTYTLFDTTTANAGMGASFFANSNTKRFLLDIKNDQAGTLKVYKSDDRGTNWNQIDQVSVAAAAATDTNTYDFLVAQYKDWKITWTNGGVTQTTYEIDMALSDEANVAG